MANKYLRLVLGKLKEFEALVTSAGAADAGKIVGTDSAGLLDISLMPVGIGPDTVVAASSENLTAGDFVNLYNNAGTINVRKADATTSAKPAHGFVLAGVTSPANATVFILGKTNTSRTGMTVGADQFLNTTAGGVTATPPSTAGNIVQYLGKATTATAMVTSDQPYVELV